MSQEGEIVARLRLDASDWHAKLEEAKAEAESLKTVDPTIRVKADTASAVAKLSAVAAAEDRYAAAVQASDRATAVALLAQMRLEEVQNKRGRTAYQVAAAEEALRYATEKSDNAALKAIAAEDALTAARHKARDAAAEEAIAAEAAAVANKKSGAAATGAAAAATGAAGPMVALVGAAIALAPALVPVGAAAVGVTAALTGMGVVGALAITGITRELGKGGKGPLQEYKGVVAQLTTEFHHLQDVAGESLFAGVKKAVAVLKADMGSIDGIIAHAGNALGSILPAAISAVVTVATRLRPAFDAGTQAVLSLIRGIDGFAKSPAFKGFVDYVVQSMPIVGSFMKSLLQLAGSLLAALAPLGTAMLKGLTPVLAALAQAMPKLGTAFNSLIPLIPSLSAALVNLVIAAVPLVQILGRLVQVAGPVLIFALNAVGTVLKILGTVLTTASAQFTKFTGSIVELERGVAPATITLEGLRGKFGPLGVAAMQLGTFLGTSVRHAVDAWKQGAQQIAGFVSSLVRDFADDGRQIVSAVSGFVGRTISQFVSLRSRILGVVSGFGSLLYSAGQNLIQGLIGGAQSMVGSVISSVQGIASSAVSAAKSLLGIKSPSTVFHEIGRFLVQGFVNGISSGHGVAHAAIRGLVPAGGLSVMASGVTGFGNAGSSVAAWPATSMAMRSTTIAPEIHIHNPVAVDPVTQVREASQYILAYATL